MNKLGWIPTRVARRSRTASPIRASNTSKSSSTPRQTRTWFAPLAALVFLLCAAAMLNALQGLTVSSVPEPETTSQSPTKPLILTAADESRMFSQNGEDGVIKAIFDQIGTTDKFYVEFGCEDGSQTNTRKLREYDGWTGLLMDGGFENASLNLHKEMIYASNVVAHFEKYSVPRFFDLLSTDTDFKDFWIAKAIMDAGYRPRVIISEVNAAFDKNLAITVPLEIEQNRWQGGSFYFGATPMAMCLLYEDYDYSLVHCEIRGINCFWVRNDELSKEEVTRFNDKKQILSTISCARYRKECGCGHCDEESNQRWWQMISKSGETGRIEIERSSIDNKQLQEMRCFSRSECDQFGEKIRPNVERYLREEGAG